MSKFFHREFLAETDDENSSESITARVSEVVKEDRRVSEIVKEDSRLSAFLVVNDGDARAWLSFNGSDKETIEKCLLRGKKLYEIIKGFYTALESEGKQALKNLKQE